MRPARCLGYQNTSELQALKKSPTPARSARSDHRWRTDNVGRLLSNALRRFEERVLALLAECGHDQTRRSHVNLTRHLDLEGTRITELARRAAMTNAAMTELIDQCEDVGLVERIADPADKRVRVVRFTPAGEQWLNDFGRAVVQAQREMAAEVGQKELGVVLTALAAYANSGEATVR